MFGYLSSCFHIDDSISGKECVLGCTTDDGCISDSYVCTIGEWNRILMVTDTYFFIANFLEYKPRYIVFGSYFFHNFFYRYSRFSTLSFGYQCINYQFQTQKLGNVANYSYRYVIQTKIIRGILRSLPF